MRIVITGREEQQQELAVKPLPEGITIHWAGDHDAGITDADAYFDLLYEENGAFFRNTGNKPVFVNVVLDTSAALEANMIRINAWPGFLQRDIMEIAGTDAALAEGRKILDALQWKYQATPDTPGLIAARIISMIINEAYFGLGEELSSRQDIDTAMKLGTNYPYGPFEWSEKIGLARIHALLLKLQQADARYDIAPALEQELNNLHTAHKPVS
jgi:3-hydroxybutyryl-CoA dehydrogenase